jgi:hypothetical protein
VHQLKVRNLLEIIRNASDEVEGQFDLRINTKYLEGKGQVLLEEAYASLSGDGKPLCLQELKFDFKIKRNLFIYDNEAHFNRYRLATLKTSLYEVFSFTWTEAYKRMCRTFEKECLKTGCNERVWYGPPVAQKSFGVGEFPGELIGNGSPGWKLNAYNDAQYDLLTRLHGYKLIRIPAYESLMLGGSLKKIDDLLLQPKEENAGLIANWVLRKVQ